jgi:prepilin-type N-terminal cleavage/methylation domain-containing protein
LARQHLGGEITRDVVLFKEDGRARMKNNRAFTLMEMMIVVIIVGAITAVAVPSYSIHIERVRSAEGVQSLTALLAAQKRYQLENNAYATVLANVDIDVAASNNFNVPTVANNAAAVASIQRRNDPNIPYTLSISDVGVVACNCIGCNPANICNRIGY